MSQGASYTAKRRPVHIVYAEQYSSREEALRRERQVKRWSSQKKELLVRGYNDSCTSSSAVTTPAL